MMLVAKHLSLALWAFCPSYTLSSSQNSLNCGVEAVAGTNPSVADWQAIFDTVAKGPGTWGPDGPSLGTLNDGCGKPKPGEPLPARFPCELLRAMAMQESSWKQFCVPDRPSDQVGGPSRTLISFDCGYGIGQVTSGMHKGEAPGFDRSRVASSPLYNLATGASILGGKWKSTKCVGDNRLSTVEHWYNATWAYNGQSYINNPNNPSYASTRGIYNPSVGGSRPYQERVWGWLEHPPSPAHWKSLKPSYPNLLALGSSGVPPTLPEPTCASPTDCTNSRATNVSACAPAPPDAGVPDAGAPITDAGATDAGTLRELAKVSDTLGAPPSGCGCHGTGSSGVAALAAAWLTRKRRLLA